MMFLPWTIAVGDILTACIAILRRGIGGDADGRTKWTAWRIALRRPPRQLTWVIAPRTTAGPGWTSRPGGLGSRFAGDRSSQHTYRCHNEIADASTAPSYHNPVNVIRTITDSKSCVCYATIVRWPSFSLFLAVTQLARHQVAEHALFIFFV